MAQIVKNSPAVQETWVQSLGWEDSLEKGMASHSSVLIWEIHGQPWGRKESDTTEQLSLSLSFYKVNPEFCLFLKNKPTLGFNHFKIAKT